jgi:hypothetical protein
VRAARSLCVNDALRAELELLCEADQALRKVAMEVAGKYGRSSPEYQEVRTRGVAQDERHTARLVAIVEEHGWPGVGLVGEDACAGAFLVLQHADLAVQRRFLPLLRAAASAGELPSRHLALLEDRVLVSAGEKQLYGTQVVRHADGTVELLPVEDETHVDERRAGVGLEPLAEYLRRFGPAGPRNSP